MSGEKRGKKTFAQNRSAGLSLQVVFIADSGLSFAYIRNKLTFSDCIGIQNGRLKERKAT